MNFGTTTNNEDLCLVDSTTTYTIVKSNNFFSYFVMQEINVSIISSITNIIEGSKKCVLRNY